MQIAECFSSCKQSLCEKHMVDITFFFFPFFQNSSQEAGIWRPLDKQEKFLILDVKILGFI